MFGEVCPIVQGHSSQVEKRTASTEKETPEMIAAARKKVSYSNVIATMALFIALGGVAVAAGLPRNSVGAKQLKRGAVTSAKLAKKSVINGKLGPNSVGPGNIGNGA